MKVIFHPEAREELVESARFLDEKTSGLGLDFLAAVQKATDRLTRFPESGPVENTNIRKCLVRGFPFTLLYEVNPDHIYIAAVMHQHRRPGYWKGRLGNPP
jgi:plasmid stabilization system protein ParE